MYVARGLRWRVFRRAAGHVASTLELSIMTKSETRNVTSSSSSYVVENEIANSIPVSWGAGRGGGRGGARGRCATAGRTHGRGRRRAALSGARQARDRRASRGSRSCERAAGRAAARRADARTARAGRRPQATRQRETHTWRLLHTVVEKETEMAGAFLQAKKGRIITLRDSRASLANPFETRLFSPRAWTLLSLSAPRRRRENAHRAKIVGTRCDPRLLREAVSVAARETLVPPFP